MEFLIDVIKRTSKSYLDQLRPPSLKSNCEVSVGSFVHSTRGVFIKRRKKKMRQFSGFNVN
jgi:hypothetical protein